MKKIVLSQSDVLYIGKVQDIKPVWQSMIRAFRERKSYLYPATWNEQFVCGRCYGIYIYDVGNEYHKPFELVDAGTCQELWRQSTS